MAHYNDLEKTVMDLIAEQMNLGKEFGVEENFRDDLGCDSIDVVEIIMALEERFDIEISDEDAEKFETTQNVISYIEGLK